MRDMKFGGISMRQFFKKRLPAFLMTMVMVMTLVPMASAAKSGDIEYEVKAGGEVKFDADDFQDFYDANASGTFRYVTFDRPSSGEYSDGMIYYRYNKSKEERFSRTDLGNTDFYYADDSYGDYALSDLSFVAEKSFESIDLTFTAHGSGKGSDDVTGTLRITSTGSSSSKGGTITYEVKAGGEVQFDAADFSKLFKKSYSGDLQYVEFDKPSSGEYSDGTIYSRYGRKNETAFTRTQLADNDFYYDDDSYGDYALDDLSFVADKGFESMELTFTAYGSNKKSVTGTLKITLTGSSSSSKGDITYRVKAGEEVEFDADDFEEYYKDNCSGSFRYVEFDKPSSSEYSDGTVYYRYNRSKEKAFSRSDFGDTSFYYDDDSYGDYALDDLSFVADKSFESIKLTFTAYGSGNKSVDGTLVITTSGSSSSGSSSSTKGDITYEVKPGGEVEFDSDDFERFYDANCSGTFRYVSFTRPGSSEYTDGTIYSRYGRKNETAFTRSDLGSTDFYFDDDSYGDYALDDLSFVADKSFTGSMKLTFTAYGSGSKSTTGTLVIKSTASGGTTVQYVGSVRYSTTPSALLQINANDLARFHAKYCSGSTMRYMVLSSVPSIGTLYYNYYGTSKYGASSRTLMNASNAAGKLFSYSPASSSEYALSELTYVPSGSNYTTAMNFTTYGTDGQMASGTILISVSAAAVAEVYTVTSKGTSVNFPASAVYSAVSTATGTALSSIQLLDLPSASAGVLYIGSSKADTSTQYTYGNGGNSMSQLRFVPGSSFTGSVTIPYLAINAQGTAVVTGTVSIGVVNSVKKFSDISTSTWCYKYVTELSDAGIISGYSNGSFQEKNTITYGAALKLIMLAAGYAEQAPTVKGSTFSGYLARAKADGLVSGNPKLNGSITRLQIAQIAAKAMKLSTTNLSNKKPFTDTSDVYVQALNAAGIIEGYFSNGTSTYKPGNTLTRGQVSAIVWRMRNYTR